MSDVEKYIAQRKKTHPQFAEGFEEGYEEFEIGVLLRQAREEAGLTLNTTDLHLAGIVSEAGYEGQCHWLMFLFDIVRPVHVTRESCVEGRLEWHRPDQIERLPMPETDRLVIWPLFWQYRGRFFAVHIDCTSGSLRWRLEQPVGDAWVDFRTQ